MLPDCILDLAIPVSSLGGISRDIAPPEPRVDGTILDARDVFGDRRERQHKCYDSEHASRRIERPVMLHTFPFQSEHSKCESLDNADPIGVNDRAVILQRARRGCYRAPARATQSRVGTQAPYGVDRKSEA